MRALLVVLCVLAGVPAHAGRPWHRSRNHTALWSPIESGSTGAVVARELAIPAEGLSWAREKGRKDAQWDLQPGSVVPAVTGTVEAYAKLPMIRTVPRQDGPGFVVQHRDGGSWEVVHTSERAPVYATAQNDYNVVWDGEILHITGVKQGATSWVDHTELSLADLVGPGEVWVGMVNEYLAAPDAMLQLDIVAESGGPVEKVYVLPVDSSGALAPGRPGLVIALGLDGSSPENRLRAAWVRADLPTPPWPGSYSDAGNPHSRFSAVAQVPVIEPYRLDNLYIDVIAEPGVGYDALTETFRGHLSGELGVGGKYWTAQVMSRPQLVGLAGWIHTRRRRPVDAGFGVFAGGWAGEAVPGVGLRLGFLTSAETKIEAEGLISPQRLGAGGRLVFIDWNFDRRQYVTGGLVGRVSLARPRGSEVLESAPRAMVGLVFSYSYRKSWVSAN